MSLRKIIGLMLGAALLVGFSAAGQAAPMSHSRSVEASRTADVHVVKAAAKHKGAKHSKQTTQGTMH